MDPRWIKCQICEFNIGSNNESSTEMIKIFFCWLPPDPSLEPGNGNNHREQAS